MLRWQYHVHNAGQFIDDRLSPKLAFTDESCNKSMGGGATFDIYQMCQIFLRNKKKKTMK